MRNDDRIRIIAMIANDAPLPVIADAMEECAHPWLDMVNGFLMGKHYREQWTIGMEEMERNNDIVHSRCRFPTKENRYGRPGYYGIVEIRRTPPDRERRTAEVCWQYTESDLRQWAKDEWDRVRPGRYFRVHPDERGTLVADEDIPKGALIAWSVNSFHVMPKEAANG